MPREGLYVFSKEFDEIDERLFKYLEKSIDGLKRKIYQRKVSDIIEVLDKVGRVFQDEESSYYKEALRDLEENIKFSPQMIKETLQLVPQILSKKSLERRLALELVDPYALDKVVERDNYDGYLKAYPKGVVFHVGAGNVFIGVLDSLVCGIITKNINIVKVSSKGSDFMRIFARAVRDVDKKGIISDTFAILKWKGGERAIEERIIKLADLIMVWGGYDVSDYYKKNTPFYIDVEIFGPKTSFGILFEDYIESVGYKEIARRIVKDVAMWDQGACSNMHDLYIVCSKREEKAIVKRLIAELGKAFDEFEKNFPQGRIDPDEMVEILKTRELACVDASFSLAELKAKKNYTIIYEKDPSYKLSPLNRTLYIKTVRSLTEILKNIKPYKHYLQTIGIGGSISQKKEVAKEFFSSGGIRFTDIGKMTEGVDGSPHDGRFVLSRLVRWVGIEGKGFVAEKLVELVRFAKENSSFYRGFYKGIEVRRLDDIKKLPFLTKDHLFRHTPPKDLSFFTDKKLSSGIFFASGGSTGRPKYVFYHQDEYDEVVKMLAYAYEAGGLKEGDVVANLFVGGNLWSSALSVEKAIAYTRAISLPIGSSLPIENIVAYLKEFNANVIIGLPSFLIRLAEYVKEKRIKLNIDKIFYGGEYVSREMIDFWRDVFGSNVKVKSGGYASADAGVIGFQCEYLDGGLHHLFDKSQYLEIVHPETLKAVPPGEIGEIVLTPLNKRVMPLIRYRIGDLGRWILERCRCGREEPVFEILGRCDERIHAGGAHIFVWDIQKAIASVKELSPNFQVIVDKKGAKDVIEIVIESAKYKDADRFIPRLRESLLANSQDLAESVKLGWIDLPTIRIVPPQTIERINRTGKIKRVVDRRIDAFR